MTDPQDDKMLTRVRRLLAKAEAASTEAERDAYNEKAAYLISQYGVDEAMAAAKDPASHLPADRVIDIDDPYARDKVQLIGAIAEPLRVRLVHVKRPDRSNQRRRWQHQAHMFGMPADLERVEVLYTSLLVQMVQWVAIARPKPTLDQAIFAALDGRRPEPIRGDQLAAWRRSWMAGFAYGVMNRLKRMEQDALDRKTRDEQAYARQQWFDGETASAEPGVALVLASQQEAVEQKMFDTYENLGRGKARKLSGYGHHEGQAAAAKANLGGTALGRSSNLTRGQIG